MTRPEASAQPERPAPFAAGWLSEEESARLRGELARAVARVCPSWLRSQTDDIVQAAVMRVMEVLRRDERRGDLGSSYLWTVAYTATVDEIRRLRRRREVTLQEASLVQADQATGVDPERVRAGSEIAEGLRDCMGRIVETRRTTVALYLQGHSVTEVARLLGWGSKRVENLVFRGLADLRRCLAAKGLRP